LVQRNRSPHLCIHPILALVFKFRSGKISFLAYVTIHEQPFPHYDYYGIGDLKSVTSTHGTKCLSQGETRSTTKQTHDSTRRTDCCFGHVKLWTAEPR